MADLTPYLIVLAVVAVYFVIWYMVKKKGFLAKRGVVASGMFIMWKTQAGKHFIDWLAKPERFWKAYATLAKVICLMVSIFIMALLIWEATIVNRIPADKAPSLEMMLGIPGINPVIPIIYGIVGLIVAMVVHEFAHGILTRVGKMSLKSLGLFFFIIPLGAFVEPDENELTKADRRRRSSVYAVGPATNVLVALLCAFIFSSLLMASAQPVRDNPVIMSVGENTPAQQGNLLYGMQIVEVDNITVHTIQDLDNMAADPGTNITVSYYYKGQLYSTIVTSGLVIMDTTRGLAADNVGIEPGMIIASLNDSVIRNQTDLQQSLALTHPFQTVNITMLSYNALLGKYQDSGISSVELSSKREYYLKVSPDLVNATFKDIGFLGINSAYLGAITTTPDKIIQRLANPLANVKDPATFISSTLLYIALPFQGLAPIESPLSDLFTPTGLIAGLPANVFWFLGNCVYWIFWINLMVGMTNVLPAIPLDGGFLFRDALDVVIHKFKKNASEAVHQRYITMITYLLAITVLFLIVWQLIGPRLF
jgi:membrane-associated protease RseP (regulator of RpoE activity)